MLASYHNLAFLHQMMNEIRLAISEDRFEQYKKDFLNRYKKGEIL
jgi:queuine tRNA-ribosyltransferase